MNSKPFGYDSLKCILFHMEGNQRIEVSRRCERIRTTEKIVPLQLKELKFLENGFQLNDIKYEIGVYQKYHTGQTPDSIRRNNETSGYSMDLDRFGLEDGRYRNILLPGDILIKEKPRPENNRTLEARIRRAEQIVRWDDDDYKAKNKLIFLNHLHENAPVPFENVLCLKISSFWSDAKVEFYEYNMNYYEAMKKLSMFLFGERLDPINAKELSVQESNIIRLPPSLKIGNISEIDILFEVKAVCEALPAVLDEPNLFLERMTISSPRVEDLTTPIVQNAKCIEISIEDTEIFRQGPEEEPLQLLTNVTNRTAHFEMRSYELSLQDLITLVRHWKESGRQIGSLLFMMFRTKQLCMDRFMDVTKQFEGARCIEGNVAVIPLSVDSEIELSWSHRERYNYRNEEWKLQLKVKTIGQ